MEKVEDKLKNNDIDNSLSMKFTKYMEKYTRLYYYLAKKTKTYLPDSANTPNIVDLSVGPGLLSLELSKIIDQAHIIGIDPSKNMLKIANEKLKICNYCNLILSKVENLPLKSCYIDIIVSRFGISSWNNLHKGFSESFRVLKPNGKLILEILNKDFPKWKQAIMKFHMRINGAGKEVIKYNIDSYKTVLNLKKIEQLLINNGFKIIEHEGKHHDWKKLIVATK